ncbi:MAG TPA: hypothetical protein VKQ72_14815 [Aggregatilineales bacterium]|nr:hypothetical protein [Aggregatilineales bacterium]
MPHHSHSSHHLHHTPTHHLHHNTSHFSSSASDSQSPQAIALGVNDPSSMGAQMTKNAVNGAGKTLGLGCLMSAIIVMVVAVGAYLLIHQVSSAFLMH